MWSPPGSRLVPSFPTQGLHEPGRREWLPHAGKGLTRSVGACFVSAPLVSFRRTRQILQICIAGPERPPLLLRLPDAQPEPLGRRAATEQRLSAVEQGGAQGPLIPFSSASQVQVSRSLKCLPKDATCVIGRGGGVALDCELGGREKPDA